MPTLHQETVYQFEDTNMKSIDIDSIRRTDIYLSVVETIPAGSIYENPYYCQLPSQEIASFI